MFNLSAIELVESREIESSSSVERGQFSRRFPCVLPSRASPRGRRPACRQRPIVDIRKDGRDWRGREPTANRDQEKENSRSPLFLGSPRLCPGRTLVALWSLALSHLATCWLRIRSMLYLGASFREPPKISEGVYGVKKFGNGDRARVFKIGRCYREYRFVGRCRRFLVN